MNRTPAFLARTNSRSTSSGGATRIGRLKPPRRERWGKAANAARAAAAVDEREEGARPDVLGANQPKPVEPLVIAEPRGLRLRTHELLPPMRDSLPIRSRSMLVKCLIQSSTASAPKMTATSL